LMGQKHTCPARPLLAQSDRSHELFWDRLIDNVSYTGCELIKRSAPHYGGTD
jgi:hypothetical protein